MPFCLSVYIFVCFFMSDRLSVSLMYILYLSIHLLDHLSLYPFIFLPVYPSIWLSIHLYDCLSICLSVSLSLPLYNSKQIIVIKCIVWLCCTTCSYMLVMFQNPIFANRTTSNIKERDGKKGYHIHPILFNINYK